MTKRSRSETQQNTERKLTSQFRAIRIRAVAGALEHQGDRNNTIGQTKRSAPQTRNKARIKGP
jgi:hypothetical protein